MPKRRRVVKIDSDGNDVQVYDTISQAVQTEAIWEITTWKQ